MIAIALLSWIYISGSVSASNNSLSITTAALLLTIAITEKLSLSNSFLSVSYYFVIS